MQTPMTMRTPMVESSIMREAYNSAVMRDMQTPLLGQENPQLREGDSQTPSRLQMQTPNVVLGKRLDSPVIGDMLPPPSKKAKAANVRDDMNLNRDINADNDWEKSSLASGVEQVETGSVYDSGQLLKSNLSMLPRPSNKFEVSMEDIQYLEKQLEKQSKVEGIEDIDEEDVEETKRVQER